VAARCLATQLLRRHCTVSVQAARRASLTARQLQRVTGLMLAELDRDLSLADLARAAGVSRSHFSRAFRDATGQAPYRWLTERRIERAKDLLCSSGMPAAEVGVQVGYPSPSHFGEMFRRHVGVTPGAYRRLVQR